MLTEKHYFGFRGVPPYSFELTVHKPAGWWWSTPNKVFENEHGLSSERNLLS
jgi:hypothetical protein